MTENQSSLQEQQGRSQHFTFPRRDFLQKAASAASLCLIARSQPDTATHPNKRPLPQFNIGDLVAQDWEPDDDEAPEVATDFGEILGMRWMPEPEGNYIPEPTWVYYVNWTHGNYGTDVCYPCYDGEPSRPCDLRLVSHA